MSAPTTKRVTTPPTTRKTSLYRLRSSGPPEAEDPRSFVVPSYLRRVGFTSRPVDHEGICGLLVSGTIAPGDADWCGPLGTLVGMTVAAENRTSLALLILRTDSAVYGLTFGMGHLMIDETHRSRVGHRAVRGDREPDRRADRRRPAHVHPGPKAPRHVTGSDRSIKLHLGTTPAGLLHDLHEIEQVCARPSPLPEFDFIAQVRPLSPKSERAARLDDRLDELLAGRELNRLALAVPGDCRDRFEFAESFTVTLVGRSAQVGELAVDDLVAAVADRPQGQRLRALRQGRIQMFADADGADRISRNVPADHWVTAELSDGVVHHFYWQGRWYEIGAEYLTVVESRIAELLSRPASVTLPPWPKGEGHDEAWYNEQVAAQPGYLLLDRRPCTPIGSGAEGSRWPTPSGPTAS